MGTQQRSPVMEEMPAFDELPEEPIWTLELPEYRDRAGHEDEELGFRALADCPEWVSRSYWRRLRAA
jgi:hypothetical protein